MNIFPNTLFVGKVCTYLNSVDSTQTYLKDMYANTAPTEGTVIMTYDQLSGYGQRESRWVGDKGKRLFIEWVINYLVIVLGKLAGSKSYKDLHPVDKTIKQTQIGDKDE